MDVGFEFLRQILLIVLDNGHSLLTRTARRGSTQGFIILWRSFASTNLPNHKQQVPSKEPLACNGKVMLRVALLIGHCVHPQCNIGQPFAHLPQGLGM